MFHSTFFDQNIYKLTKAVNGLRWESYCKGQFIRADTLGGLRSMIRERVTKP